jgi:hypothetical protein
MDRLGLLFKLGGFGLDRLGRLGGLDLRRLDSRLHRVGLHGLNLLLDRGSGGRLDGGGGRRGGTAGVA